MTNSLSVSFSLEFLKCEKLLLNLMREQVWKAGVLFYHATFLTEVVKVYYQMKVKWQAKICLHKLEIFVEILVLHCFLVVFLLFLKIDKNGNL